MPKQFTNWLDEFVENGADKNNVPNWSTQSGGGGSYTPGNGINIVGNEISVDTQTIATKEDLNNYEPAEDAFSGDYNDLDNKPTIPTDTSDLTNNAGFITGITSTDVTTALGYTPGTSNFSGDYDDLTDKPTIPDAVSGTNDGTNWTSLTIGSVTKNIPAGSGSSYTAGTGIDITNDEISVDNTVAMKTDIPDAVSGVHDTANWTSLTIGSDTYAIPTSSGGDIIEVNTTNFNILGSSPAGRLSGIYKVNSGHSDLTITSGNNSIVISNYNAQGNCVIYIHIYNNMNINQRNVFWYAFAGVSACTIYYGYVTAGISSGTGIAKSVSMSNLINRDLISYKLSLTFTKDNVDSYMDFIFSNENVIGNINTTTFKALFDTTETLTGDKKLCDINHTVRIYNNGTYTIGDIYYDSTTDTFGTVDGTITGLTLSSIVKTEKSHTLPS